MALHNILTNSQLPQTTNPNSDEMNYLGVYLLTSFSFIMVAMVEFAGVMLLQRQNSLVRTNQVGTNGPLARRGSFEMDDLTTKIDMMALTLFSLSYIVFNIGHWAANVI